MIISETVIVVVFLIAMLVAALLAWYMEDYGSYDDTAFHTFISVLLGFGIFITILYNYNIVALQNQQQNVDAFNEFTSVTDMNYNTVMKNMREASSIIPYFVSTINPLSEKPEELQPDELTVKNVVEKHALSYHIFSMWQDAIMMRKVIEIGSNGFIAEALQRANSELLYKEWLISKVNFDCKTNKFVDLLFKYGLDITEQKPESYSKASHALLEDPVYLNIHL